MVKLLAFAGSYASDARQGSGLRFPNSSMKCWGLSILGVLSVDILKSIVKDPPEKFPFGRGVLSGFKSNPDSNKNLQV